LGECTEIKTFDLEYDFQGEKKKETKLQHQSLNASKEVQSFLEDF